MGEQARRRAGEDFVHRSIHEAVEWHRTMRRRAKARACIETIYFRGFEAAPEVGRPSSTYAGPAPRPPLTITPEVRKIALARTYLRAKPIRVRKPNAERDAFRAEASDLRNKLLFRIVALQGGRCYICAGQFGWANSATMDHVTPRDPKAGGGKNAGNILAAHKACNNRKANRAPYACEILFLEIVNEQLREPASDGLVEAAE